MYAVLKENSGNVVFPPNSLCGNYEFHSGTVVLKRNSFFILYKILQKNTKASLFDNAEENVVLTEDFKRIDVKDLNEPWLVKSFGNVVLEREEVNSIFVTITFDFSSATEWVYSINGENPKKLFGSSKVSHRTIDFHELYGTCDNMLVKGSRVYTNGKIEKVQNIFSHNTIEESNIINLSFLREK